jgi:hypothetical protein
VEATGPSEAPAAAAPPIEPAGDQAAGVQTVGRMLAAATTARWPMYLRNVKQILRAADSGFDERRYGFGGIMDLLRACQREGLIRLERDRRGGLRVFQGAALQRAVPAASSEPAHTEMPRHDETPQPLQAEAPIEGEVVDLEPMPMVDPTAELLGRAKPKRPRTRAGSSVSAAAGAHKKAARTAAPSRVRSAKPRPGTRKASVGADLPDT